MTGRFAYIEIEDQCPICGHDIEVALNRGPTACPGCSFEIDPDDLKETMRRLEDILHKTMPGQPGQGIRDWKRQIRLRNMGALALRKWSKSLAEKG